MYHELFVLLSHADENNGLLKLHSLPDFINELLAARGTNVTLKKVLKKLTRHQLLEKIDHETYQITQLGRWELNEYKMYIEQQHQKGPDYHVTSLELTKPPKRKFYMLTVVIALSATFGYCK